MRLALCPIEAGSAESQHRKDTPRTEDSVPTGHAGRAVGLATVEISRLADQAVPHSEVPPESKAQLEALRQPPATPERLPSGNITTLPDAAASQPRRRTKQIGR